ncbi:hypothetical protein OC844_000873 [Tilletia horrida]|nr:hypothetical protein OC844_000873 [Tilletia horrida]
MDAKRALSEDEWNRYRPAVDKATLRWARIGKALTVLCALAVAYTATWQPFFEVARHSSSDKSHRIISHPHGSEPKPGDPFHFVPCYPDAGAGSARWKCGYLDVPLDYTNKSDSRTARLAVVMYQVGAKKSKQTIVINPGGPGGSGTYYAVRRGEMMSRNYTDHTMDVLGFDPRGVNMSTPSYSCFGQDAYRDRWSALTTQFPETAKNPIEHLRLTDAYAVATWKACDEKFGDMGRFLSTAFVARDLDSIRAALGEETLNAYMVSYGTNIAATYSQMFPERVGRMLLDGVDPADHAHSVEGWGTGAIGDIEKGFVEGVLGECVRSGPEGCALAKDNTTVEDLKQSMWDLFDRLKKHPLPATHPELGPGVVTFETVDSIIYSALYSSPSWPLLARMLAGLKEGNGTLALQMQEWNFDPTLSVKHSSHPGWTGVHVPKTASEELTLAVVCSDSFDSKRHNLTWWNELQSKMVSQSYLGGSVNFGYVFPCKSFKLKVAEVYRGRWDHDLKNPVLIIGETHDPATPLRGARHIHKVLGKGNSRLIEHHGYGHSSADRSGNCTERIKRELFLHGKLPEADVTECFADTKPYPHPAAKSAAATGLQPAGVGEEREFTLEDWATSSPKAEGGSKLPVVTIFTGPQCSLCEELKHELKPIQKEHPFQLTTYDIHDRALPDQPKWHRLYRFDIPVLHIAGKEVLRHRLTEKNRPRLVEALREAAAALGGGGGGGGIKQAAEAGRDA